MVVGAGPVGLYVACLLAAAGRSVTVLEQRGLGAAGSADAAGSRAVGIHPPALEALAQVGVADELLACGCRIESVRLLLGQDHVGDMSLKGCPGPYRFVLTVPQRVTEGVLEARLETLRPGALRRASTVVGVTARGTGMELELESGERLQGDFVIGCDGRSSLVREALAVAIEGGALGHHYLMADLPDDGSLGRDAAISLGEAGVVESFPLPRQRRRWVARFPTRPDGLTAEDLAAVVERRTGLVVEAENTSASTFTAERRLARRLAGPTWALVGDAAHVISPIGGQGMNLGLLGGRRLLEALTTGGDRSLAQYEQRQRLSAVKAARRAGLNMLLGSDRLPPGVRWAALRLVLLGDLQPRFARYFTMRGL